MLRYLFWKDLELSYAGKTYSTNYLTKGVVPIQDYEDIEI